MDDIISLFSTREKDIEGVCSGGGGAAGYLSFKPCQQLRQCHGDGVKGLGGKSQPVEALIYFTSICGHPALQQRQV